MVDENDEEFDGQEEGEYHFSDEQVNYDTDEPAKVAPTKKPEVKSSPLSQPGGMRRMIIGGAVFVGLLYFVYKMIMPASTPPTTEITQAKPMTATVPKATPASPAPVTAAAAPQQPTMAPVSVSATGQQPPVIPGVAPQPDVVIPVAAPANGPAPAPGVAPSDQPPAPMPAQAMQGASLSPEAKQILDKLSALEQQNTHLASLVETDYPQKMASYEDKTNALQSKVDDLNTRVASIESSINQVTRLLKEGSGEVQTVPTSPPPLSKIAESSSSPKILYVVQAIIPGRAWLKSDSGETVTVAEGDTIKGLGRVIKIDPYDGVVEIACGNKIVTLTYGGT